MLTILSLGAGVQSTTVLLRSLRGDEGFPKLDAAIFADVLGNEPRAVYEHLERLAEMCEQCGLPLYIVGRDDRAEGSGHWKFASQIPSFVRHPNGEIAMGRRQCTRDFKIDPIRRKVRELVGLAPGQAGPRGVIARQAIGISLDEVRRMKDSGVRWLQHFWPLIDLRLTRRDCQRWLAENWPYPVPRSACVMCPFHSDHEWRQLRDNDRESWERAVAFDKELRRGGSPAGMTLPAYVHRSAVPLDEADLSTPEDHGQLSLWTAECEGMCGV